MEIADSLIPILTALQRERDRIRNARGIWNLKQMFLDGAVKQGVGMTVADASGDSVETYSLDAEETRQLAKMGLGPFVDQATRNLNEQEDRLSQSLRTEGKINVRAILTVMAGADTKLASAREAAGYFVIEKLGSKAGDAIEAALFDADETIRFQAAHVLRFVRTERTVDCLLRALGDSDGDVRAMTAAALARHGDTRAIPVLKELAEKDTAPGVRKTAADAVQALQSGWRGTKFF